MAPMADFSSWGPHQTLHSGVEPIGAVPTPTLVILRSLLPRRLVSSVNPVQRRGFENDYFYLELKESAMARVPRVLAACGSWDTLSGFLEVRSRTVCSRLRISSSPYCRVAPLRPAPRL